MAEMQTSNGCEYSDTDVGYECSYPAVSGRHHCKFHDSQYGKEFPEDVLNSIRGLIAEAIENEGKPLECIGFIIPMKL